MKYLHISLFLAMFGFVSSSVMAQKSPFNSHDADLFADGKAFFENQNYAAAARCFEEFLQYKQRDNDEQIRQADYYIARSAFELRKKDAQIKLEIYQSLYPYATDIELINLYIGILDYEAGRYKQAIRRFETIKMYKLRESELVQLQFYKGYAYHQQEDYEKSRVEFQQVLRKGESSPYYVAANYYYAYAEQQLGNLNKALTHFLKVEHHPEFDTTAPFFIAQIHYQKGDCGTVLSYGKDLLIKFPRNTRRNELLRMMGECSFLAKNYPASINYLSQYEQAVKRIAREDFYMLGIANYMVGEYERSVANLSKTTNREDFLSQNSYLYLGMSYLKLKDKKNARLSFEAASRYTFDKDIQEEALYNFAVVSYEESFSPFNESVVAFERFLTEFPQSKRKDKVYEYLANSYLTTKNYSEAYRSIQNLKTDNVKIKEAEERILFNMGIVAVANSNYTQSTSHLEKIIKGKSYNADIKNRTYYWYGESLLNTGYYSQAEKNFEMFLQSARAKKSAEYVLAHYSLGYTYFRLKNYNDAVTWFRKYIGLNPDNANMVLDANNRIGDSYYQNRQFAEAKRFYNQAIATGAQLPGADYATFQKGFVAGLERNHTEKISILNGLVSSYPQSEWVDDALIEIGKTYVVLKENDKAIESFMEIERKFARNGQLIRQARLQIAMLQYNDGKMDLALESYKQIVRNYPSSEEARTSLEAIENILVEGNRVSEYTEFIGALGKGAVQIAPSREDSLMFRAAQRAYSRNEIPQAISSFEKYVQTYPKGMYSSTARYLLASCYYTQKQPEKALPIYKSLMSDKENPNEEETYARAAEISYDLGQYAESLEYFKQLEQIGSSENKMAARIGLMRSSFILKRYEATISAASDFIALHANNIELVREAQHKRMLSYLNINKAPNALPDMQILAKDTRNVYGAEAKYLLATHYYLTKQYESAEKEVFDFIDKGTPHHTWLAKSFILLADVYMEQDNYFEAKQYLLSLRNNYPAGDVEITTAINTRLDEIAKIENEKVNN